MQTGTLIGSVGRGGFSTPLNDVDGTLAGPWRTPRQMLATQEYEGHASIHDDATAQKLGFRGGTIEGPTHFTQFEPLCVALWGDEWFKTGCISAHYRNAVFEGEHTRARLQRSEVSNWADIWMEKEDGTEVLRGSVSITGDPPTSALFRRLQELPHPGSLNILQDVHVGMRKPRRRVVMGFDQTMGALYPFTLKDKLQRVTEACDRWTLEGALRSPWGRPVLPLEMVSVLLNYTNREDPFPIRGAPVGLFADQEIRLLEGPLFVGQEYEMEREVVALSQSRRTESMWVRTNVMLPGQDRVVASMLLNGAILKETPRQQGDEG
jgi:hypothetical protein